MPSASPWLRNTNASADQNPPGATVDLPTMRRRITNALR